MRAIAFLAACLAVAPAGPVAAATASTPPATAASAAAPIANPSEAPRWDWTGDIAAGQSLRIDNPWGDVRARFGGHQRRVEVHAILQNLHPGEPGLRVVTPSTPTELAIRVEPIAPKPSAAAMKGKPDRADLVVFVPEGVAVTASTKSGTLEIRGLKGNVRAESESGTIRIRQVDGLVRTKNVWGVTHVTLERAPEGSEQLFESTTGDITVISHAASEPLIRAESSGEIGTDYSIEIERHPKSEPDKSATARVGRANSTVTIRSKRGNLHLLRRLESDHDTVETDSD